MGSIFADDEFSVNTVEDTTAPSDAMTGDASNVNLAKSGMFSGGNPTRGLVMLWFLALALYWAIGFFFRRVRG